VKEAQGQPELAVTLAGRRLRREELAVVASLQVRTALAQPAQCTITWDLDETVRVAPLPGDALRVELGQGHSPLFVGEVTVVEHGHGADGSTQVRLRAYDALHRLRKRQSTRAHVDVDLAGLTRTLSSGTGLEVVAPPLSLGTIYQCARSDLDLLVATAARAGVYPVVDGTTLRLVGLQGDGEPVVLTRGSTLHSAELEVSQEPSYRAVEAVRWDPASATAAGLRASGHSARAGTRADPAPETVGGGGVLTLADEVATDDAVMRALAQAELDVRSGAEVTATLVADGDPRLRAGGRVRLVGVAPTFEGTYLVTEAVHVVDGAGYETRVSSVPPVSPRGRGPDRVTLGAVSDAADPEGRARVKVRLLALPDLETTWAPVLVAAAGPGKGAVLLPEVGDTVLVLLLGGDPAEAVVLGGLYGREPTPDHGDGGHPGQRFTLATADGQRLQLDATGRRVVLTDGHGSEVELGPDLLRIHAATDLLIEAPGKALRVRARSVDFEEAT